MNDNVRSICCIDHLGQRLYAELIQVVEDRQMAWLRPLALLDAPYPTNASTEAVSDWDSAAVYDLQDEADLLCPKALIRRALDTEVIPLLSHLARSSKPRRRGRLRQFLEQVYADTPERFNALKG